MGQRAFLVYDRDTGGVMRMQYTDESGGLVLYAHESRLELSLEDAAPIEKFAGWHRVENGSPVRKAPLALTASKLRLVADGQDEVRITFQADHAPVLVVNATRVDFATIDPEDGSWDEETGEGVLVLQASSPGDFRVRVLGPGTVGTGDPGDAYHYSDRTLGESGVRPGAELVINAQAPETEE
jgi:hypothetical protein